MYYRIDRVTGSREVIAWRGPIRIRNDKRACGCRSAFAMAATAATPMEPAGLAGEPASNVYIVDTGKQPFLQGGSRWRYQHGHGRTSPRPPASRSTLPAVSLSPRPLPTASPA